MLPKFIVTRFCHGSGGKLVSTILQTHPQVQHWTRWIETNKNTDFILDLVRIHAQRSFPTDHSFYLRDEPIAPYDTSLWSSTHDRGQDLSLLDLQNYFLQNPDHYFEEGLEKNLYINIIFHKFTLPKFCSGAHVVTIAIDNDRSLDWAQRTLWKKHFIELDDKIIYCPNHPLYCPNVSVPAVLKYNNQCEFDKDQKTVLMQKYISKNQLFQQFMVDGSAEDKNHSSIPVSALFERDRLIGYLQNLTTKLNWYDFDLNLVTAVHQSWIDSQLPY